MTNQINLHDRRQSGFTLVELAIVMIIIGLLIGGVLKGQQLINNAEIAATVSQVQGIDAAATTFRDMYNGMPGDIAPTRLANCVGTCNVPTTSINNMRLEPVDSSGAAPTNERLGFWGQLAAADVFSGANPAATDTAFGQQLPQADIGGGYDISYSTGGQNGLVNHHANGQPRAGHYLALYSGAATGMPSNGFLTPQEAFRIDSKIDDGSPQLGSVIAAGHADCITTDATTNQVAYNEGDGQTLCNLYFRVQQ